MMPLSRPTLAVAAVAYVGRWGGNQIGALRSVAAEHSAATMSYWMREGFHAHLLTGKCAHAVP